MHVMPIEPHTSSNRTTLNWLRAAVLGANDGIISLSGLVIGVAGATDSRTIIIASGVAGLLAGAFSMAAGEFVSVSTQRDSEQALLAKERRELDEMPEEELAELVSLYQAKGLSPETATRVAKELTKHNVYAAHIDVELGIDPNNLTNPWQAAFASALAFVAGAIIPLIAIVIIPPAWRVPGTFSAVVIALLITGILSAAVSGTSGVRASVRVVLGGVLAMAVTYAVGTLFRVSGI
jgi:VIT1/CCC1 family predicted Fe2+/Mn2+ transporter